MRGGRYVDKLHCSQCSRAAMTYSSRIPLAPQERTHRSENPVALSKYALRTHLHVGSAPLPEYVWGTRVPPRPPLRGVGWLCWAGAALAGAPPRVSGGCSGVQYGWWACASSHSSSHPCSTGDASLFIRIQ